MNNIKTSDETYIAAKAILEGRYDEDDARDDKRRDDKFAVSDARSKIMYEADAMMAELQRLIDIKTKSLRVEKIDLAAVLYDSPRREGFKLFELIKFYLGGGKGGDQPHLIAVDLKKRIPNFSKQQLDIVADVIEDFVNIYKQYFRP